MLPSILQTTDDDIKHILIHKKKKQVWKVHTKTLTKVTYGIMGSIFSFYLDLSSDYSTTLWINLL